MTDTDLPQGHITHDGLRYVALDLLEAANRHVTEQGQYHNQLIATLNEQGREIHALRADKNRLQRQLDEVQEALAECRRTQAAMRKAVYGAAEGL